MKNLSEVDFRPRSRNVSSTAMKLLKRLLVWVRNLFFPQSGKKPPRTRPVVDYLADLPTNDDRPTKIQPTTRTTHRTGASAVEYVVDLVNCHADFASNEENQLTPRKVQRKKVPSSNKTGIGNNKRPMQSKTACIPQGPQQLRRKLRRRLRRRLPRQLPQRLRRQPEH